MKRTPVRPAWCTPPRPRRSATSSARRAGECDTRFRALRRRGEPSDRGRGPDGAEATATGPAEGADGEETGAAACHRRGERRADGRPARRGLLRVVCGGPRRRTLQPRRARPRRTRRLQPRRRVGRGGGGVGHVVRDVREHLRRRVGRDHPIRVRGIGRVGHRDEGDPLGGHLVQGAVLVVHREKVASISNAAQSADRAYDGAIGPGSSSRQRRASRWAIRCPIARMGISGSAVLDRWRAGRQFAPR